jgi:spore coat polysaccharide biosynthesis protein SpsF
VVAIVQARMQSTRLPGKVLLDLAGQPMLRRVLDRASATRRVDAVVVATSTHAADDELEARCAGWGVPCSRGSESDVLSRFLEAAHAHRAEAVVRLTSDCPLLDPAVCGAVVERFLEGDLDYASTGLTSTWPRGLDTEVFSLAALERAGREASLAHERTHVTPYLYLHPELFRVAEVRCPEPHPDERWTVDTPDDLALVRAIYEQLGPRDFGWRDVLRLLTAEPALRELNRHVRQKALEEG